MLQRSAVQCGVTVQVSEHFKSNIIMMIHRCYSFQSQNTNVAIWIIQILIRYITPQLCKFLFSVNILTQISPSLQLLLPFIERMTCFYHLLTSACNCPIKQKFTRKVTFYFPNLLAHFSWLSYFVLTFIKGKIHPFSISLYYRIALKKDFWSICLNYSLFILTFSVCWPLMASSVLLISCHSPALSTFVW